MANFEARNTMYETGENRQKDKCTHFTRVQGNTEGATIAVASAPADVTPEPKAAWRHETDDCSQRESPNA